MQHFDITSVRSAPIALPCDAAIALNPVLDVPRGWAFVDTSTEDMLPEDDFLVEVEVETISNREFKRRRNASKKIRQLTRRAERATKRASQINFI